MNLPKGFVLESNKPQPMTAPQTLYTEETIYDPVSGLPLSSPSYGPEAQGGVKTAQNVLTGAAALPISIATGVARGSGAARIPQLVEALLGSKSAGSTNALGQIEKGMEQQGGEYLQKGANIAGQVFPYVVGGMQGSLLGNATIPDKVLGFNAYEDSTVLAKPSYIMRHKTKKKLYQINLKNGKSVKVTEDHSIMVDRDGFLIEVKPSEILDTDLFICLKR